MRFTATPKSGETRTQRVSGVAGVGQWVRNPQAPQQVSLGTLPQSLHRLSLTTGLVETGRPCQFPETRVPQPAAFPQGGCRGRDSHTQAQSPGARRG